ADPAADFFMGQLRQSREALVDLVAFRTKAMPDGEDQLIPAAEVGVERGPALSGQVRDVLHPSGAVAIPAEDLYCAVDEKLHRATTTLVQRKPGNLEVG